VQRFKPLGIAPPGTGAVQFEISAGLGHVFRNLTRILGKTDIDDPSARKHWSHINRHSACPM